MRRSSRITRQSVSTLPNDTVSSKQSAFFTAESEEPSLIASGKPKSKKRTAVQRDDASDFFDDAEEIVREPDADSDADATNAKSRVKRRKIATGPSKKSKNGNASTQIHERIFASSAINGSATCSPPNRAHNLSYHRPLLLDSEQGRGSLLAWFDEVSTKRNMPWRKAWIDPSTVKDDMELRSRLEHRAYEVWISEIMLQQTRVATVIDYWTRWIARWPSIQDLAEAQPDEVLAAWRGLGYYSRATRIHDGAKIVCADKEMQGLLPSNVDELVARVPGVGRYTAGAISAIVFGRAAPMVDGNVLRVLSRQLGLFGDVKADKSVIDVLWAAADRLVKAVARDSTDAPEAEEDEGEQQLSDRPGRWGQALMELGSTVCTPKPNCAACPISASCRAYDEGLQLATKKGHVSKPAPSNGSVTDIEDACTLCKPFEEFAEDDDDKSNTQISVTETSKQQKSKSRMQATLQAFAFTTTTRTSTRSAKTTSTSTSKPPNPSLSPAPLSTTAVEVIANHARKFPVKVVKKAVREEETLVCAIRRATSDGSDGQRQYQYLIHRRPDKGLLAGLWELPSWILEDPKNSAGKMRRSEAGRYVAGLVGGGVRHVRDLGNVPWQFSHLKLTMHVHLFELEGGAGEDCDEEKENKGSRRKEGVQSRWCDAVGVDEESMGTGMRKCWALVKEASEE
ncbi:DNA glycosylase [Hypoxylon fuscum]|nr:DNA glycosylase [Hypoxylon fuscum]